jgi:hypothetical protein
MLVLPYCRKLVKKLLGLDFLKKVRVAYHLERDDDILHY